MIVTVSGPASLAEYVDAGGSVSVPRPGKCEECASRKIWRHTGYSRMACDSDGRRESVWIERFRCGECGLVMSCLFEFLIPYVRYTLQVVAAWISQYIETAGMTYEILGWSGNGDEKTNAFRKVGLFSSLVEELMGSVQTEAMLNRPENVEMRRAESECPNSHRAHSAEKSAALNNAATLIAWCRELMQCAQSAGDEILHSLHCYFMTTAESSRSILSGRKRLGLSNQQSLQRAIF